LALAPEVKKEHRRGAAGPSTGGETEFAITLRGGASDADPRVKSMLAVATCCGKDNDRLFCRLARIKGERLSRFWIILGTRPGIRGSFMHIHLTVLLLASGFAFSTIAAAEPIPYSKAVQQFCAADYRKYCGDYGLESAALRSCMDRAGDSLSPSCVKALVSSGEVSQAEVDRRKKSGH
jgi:hypothetical protein